MVNEARAMAVIEFIQLLKHTGDFHGQPFILLPWQLEIIWEIYGRVNEVDGLRQYRKVYLELPKKQGKTELAAALLLFHDATDPPGGEIYCAAADREQASKVYQAACEMRLQSKSLTKRLRLIDSKKEIHNRATGTFVKVLSSESKTKHGLNPSVIIFDELHAQPNRDLWDVLTFGSSSARLEPLLLVITTSGNDPDRKSIGWEVHEMAVKIQDGELDMPNWYVKIYGAPEASDIFDEDVWRAANPSLGVAVKIETLREEANEARNSEATERLFRWLRLNQWVSTKAIGWLPITLWDTTVGKWRRSDLQGKYCYVGVDLSSKIDLTAIVCVFPPQPGVPDWRFFIDCWVPKDNMAARIKRDHVKYDEWESSGHLHTTEGNVVDYGILKNHIEYLDLTYRVKYFCGDPWHLEILKQLLSRRIQSRFIEIVQSMAGMSQGMGEFERLMRAGLITHEIQPLGRWCFGNVIIATDGNENQKPMKNKSRDRIDPIVAVVDAMAGAIKLEKKVKSSYEEHGIIMMG